MIKLIVFDFDGVLENTYEKHYELSAKRTKDLTREEHKRLFEGNIMESLEKMKHRATGFSISGLLANHTMVLKTSKKTHYTLTKLSKEYVLGIISSSWEYILQGYLKNNNLLNCFSFVYGKETSFSKLEKFNLAMKKFKLNKNEIVFVTDTLGDILEANKAGIKTIAVDFGFHERWRLEKGKPFAIISKFEELPEVISRIA